VILFGNLMRREVAGRKPGVDFLEKNSKLLDDLVLGYEDPEVAVICGQLLRVCLDNESLAQLVLHSEHFLKFFTFVENPGFDVASDAFATFKVLSLPPTPLLKSGTAFLPPLPRFSSSSPSWWCCCLVFYAVVACVVVATRGV
jgi:hypothetical protein